MNDKLSMIVIDHNSLINGFDKSDYSLMNYIKFLRRRLELYYYSFYTFYF